MSYFSINLKKLRKAKRLSQSEFARIFSLTRATVGAYEEGRAEPKLDKLIEIANYFGLSVDQLISKKLSVNEIFRYDQKLERSLNSIPFVPLADKKTFIEAMKYGQSFDYKHINIPGLLADIAIEVEDFSGLKNTIVFGVNPVRATGLKWKIGVSGKSYIIVYDDENFDGVLKFWNVCCLLSKDIDNLVHTDARLQRIEAKLDLLIKKGKL